MHLSTAILEPTFATDLRVPVRDELQSMLCVCVKMAEGQLDGSLSCTSTYCQACPPDFDIQKPHGGK